MNDKLKLQDWTKEQLIDEVVKLRKRKRYGLVWEENPENVVEQCRSELPVLKEVKNKAITKDKNGPVNILIEGDNYHALSVLNYTHKGKIDAIYIDPPYNTGAKDWKYNNRFVDSNDSYKHSKWLSMMNSRLKLSKNLLSDTGIICCTVDDYEAPRLTMLMDEIFGEQNRLGIVVIKNNPSGRSTERGFSIAHEYALFYSRSQKSSIGRLPRTDAQISRYKEVDKNGRFEWVNFRKHGAVKEESPKMFYPIYVSKENIRVPEMKWDENNQEWIPTDKPSKKEQVIYPIDEHGFNRRWKWGLKRAKKEIGEMKVQKDRNGNSAIYIKSRLNDKGMLPLTWWDKTEYSATAYGTNLLKKLFGKLQVFSYPKSIYAVTDCLKVLCLNKNGVFLDFFAGSGTTGHAVLMLNNEDEGNRKFILCTNNENNIATDVCYPRIKKVIDGYKEYGEITKIPANLKYFRTNFVSAQPDDKNKEILTNQATEMLCMREDAFESVKEMALIKIFKNSKQHIGIVFDETAIPVIKKEITSIGGNWKLYIFSHSDDDFQEEFEGMGQKINIEPIPEAILKTYRRLFKP